MPQYFYPKNHRTYFPIATPAARAPHSTRGPLPAAKAEILTVIFWCKNIRASGASCRYCYFLSEDNLFPIATPAARVSHSTRGSLPAASA